MGMPSPFPGMDPFLETQPRWKLFHDWFVRKIAEINLPRAEQIGCWIDVERDIYQREPTGELVLLGAPDEVLAVQSEGGAWRVASGAGGVMLAEPQAVHEIVLDPDEMDRHKQDYLVVRENDQFARVVAVVEVLSPANKQGKYVPKYQEKRRRCISSTAHFMEIDLLREGEGPSRALFPELPRTPYFIFVARQRGMGRNEEGHPLRLQDPLPVIGLPVGPGRPDLPLELPAAFAAAYDLTVRPRSIRYGDEPVPGPQLSPEDAAWVREVAASVR
jgi:hypothetical protein